MKYPHRGTWIGALALLSLSLTAAATVAQGPAALPDAPSFSAGYDQTTQSSSAAADTAGLVQGIVTDGNGALIPGASVTLSEKGHARLLDTTTDSSGHFLFGKLGAGTYTVLVAAPTFKTYFSPLITLQPGEVSTLPTITLGAASAEMSIDVSADSTAVAEQEIKREEQQRILGIVPNFYTSFVYDAAPLNTRQKFKLDLRSLTDPTIFLATAMTAGAEQYEDTFPSWGNSDAASYGKRYAAAYGDAILTHTFSYALYPAIFHQDPRYFYLGPTNKLSTRILHAVSYGVIARGDNGHQQLNYSHLLGSASAGAVSSVYHPASDSPAFLAGINLGIGIGTSAFEAVFREFVWPHFTTHVPSYANGRTAETPSTKP